MWLHTHTCAEVSGGTIGEAEQLAHHTGYNEVSMYFMPNVWVLEFICSQAGGKSLPMSLWIMPFPSRTDSAGMVSVMTSHGHICLSPGGHPAQWPLLSFGHHHHYHPPPPPTNPGYAGADPGGPGKHVMCPLDPQRWVMCAPPPTTLTGMESIRTGRGGFCHVLARG